MLTHRYSFDTDASDSVGGADGVVEGNAVIANGALVLDGTNSFVQLPNDLLTNYTSLSLEAWYSDAPLNTTNAQLFTFGGGNGSLSYQLDGRANLTYNHVVQGVGLPAPAVGCTNHVIWTLDNPAHTASLYVNGILAARSTSVTFTPAVLGSTTNDYLGGCGRVTTATNFHGSLLEFRIYQDVLTPLEAAVLHAFGPEQAQSNPGALRAVHLVVPGPIGPGALFRAGVYADFESISNVDISTQPDLVLTADNTNVLSIAPDQRVLTRAVGAANLTATWHGCSNTVAVSLSVPPDIALLHRYSFNEPTNEWIVHDSVGQAHGRLVNVGSRLLTTAAAFTGQGQLWLSGGTQVLPGGYAALPPGLISGLSEVTLETWVTWTPGNVPLTYGNGAWQMIFDFGNQQYTGSGVSYLCLTPATDNVSYTTKPLLHTTVTTNLNTHETPRLDWTDKLPTNVLTHVAVAYSPLRGVMKLYLNGLAVAAGKATLPLSGIVDTNCWLGKSLFSPDAYFYGSYHEFRIFSGLLSDADMAAEFAAGPEVVGVDYRLHAFGSTNALVVTWGTSASNVALKASPVLGPAAAWSPVGTSPVLQAGRYQVTVPVTNPTAFFQLQSP